MRRAFVVSVKAANSEPGSFCGRAEHVLSGKAAEFTNLSQFLEFVENVLRVEAGANQAAAQPVTAN